MASQGGNPNQQINPAVFQRAQAWTKCLDEKSLASFFLMALMSKLMLKPNMFEKAEAVFTDDKLEIKIEVPVNRIDFVGEKGWDYVVSFTFIQLTTFLNAVIRVEAEDPVVRTIATAMAEVIRKLNDNVEIEGAKEEDFDRAYECFKWLKYDVKTILKAIERKAMRKECTRKRCKFLVKW